MEKITVTETETVIQNVYFRNGLQTMATELKKHMNDNAKTKDQLDRL